MHRLDRNIDAARDVQAAINAARGQLPATLPTNPSYKKNNPSNQPIYPALRRVEERKITI
jgi:multidrug efflux pump